MNDMETLNTNVIKQEIANEEVKLEELDNKTQEELDNKTQEELDNKTQEELNNEQEKIELRIKKLEEKKEEMTKDIELFLNKIVLIIESGITPKEQKQEITKQGLFDLLPKSVSDLIDENFNKFNFIDYKIAEVLLEDDLIGKEIEKLKEEKELISEKIETEEVIEEKQDNLRIEDIENELKEGLELGGENTDILEGDGVISNNNLDHDGLKEAEQKQK